MKMKIDDTATDSYVTFDDGIVLDYWMGVEQRLLRLCAARSYIDHKPCDSDFKQPYWLYDLLSINSDDPPADTPHHPLERSDHAAEQIKDHSLETFYRPSVPPLISRPWSFAVERSALDNPYVARPEPIPFFDDIHFTEETFTSENMNTVSRRTPTDILSGVRDGHFGSGLPSRHAESRRLKKKKKKEEDVLHELMAKSNNAVLFAYVVKKFATDPHHWKILEQCIEAADDAMTAKLLAAIADNAVALATDKCGNFVLQRAIQDGDAASRDGILRRLDGHYVRLSLDMFGSHVVQTCIDHTEGWRRASVVRQIMHDDGLREVLRDRYGNYVIQTAIEQSEGDLLSLVVDAIEPHVDDLRKNLFGKLILKNTDLGRMFRQRGRRAR